MDIGRERMRLSRTASTRSLILLGAAVYLILIALTGAVARAVGSDYAELAQAISPGVALGAGGLLLASSRSRAWLSVMISTPFLNGRASGRVRVFQYVWISGVHVNIKK